MADAIVDALVALLLLLSVAAGLLAEQRGGGVGKNPPLSDEAKGAMRRFLDEQDGRG